MMLSYVSHENDRKNKEVICYLTSILALCSIAHYSNASRSEKSNSPVQSSFAATLDQSVARHVIEHLRFGQRAALEMTATSIEAVEVQQTLCTQTIKSHDLGELFRVHSHTSMSDIEDVSGKQIIQVVSSKRSAFQNDPSDTGNSLSDHYNAMLTIEANHHNGHIAYSIFGRQPYLEDLQDNNGSEPRSQKELTLSDILVALLSDDDATSDAPDGTIVNRVAIKLAPHSTIPEKIAIAELLETVYDHTNKIVLPTNGTKDERVNDIVGQILNHYDHRTILLQATTSMEKLYGALTDLAKMMENTIEEMEIGFDNTAAQQVAHVISRAKTVEELINTGNIVEEFIDLDGINANRIILRSGPTDSSHQITLLKAHPLIELLAELIEHDDDEKQNIKPARINMDMSFQGKLLRERIEAALQQPE